MSVIHLKLSSETCNLIDELHDEFIGINISKGNDTLSLNQALSLLQVSIADKKFRHKVELLRLSLLRDIEHSFFSNKDTAAEVSQQNGWASITFGLCTLAGVLSALCQGYDGVASVMGLFPVPTGAVFGISVLFSILSVIVYYGFYSAVIAENLKVKFSQVSEMVESFIEQTQHIKRLRKNMADSFVRTSPSTLPAWKELITSLDLRCQQLEAECQALKESIDTPLVKSVKAITIALTSIMYFSSGFFAGNSLLPLLGVTLSAYAWPILLFSSVMGMAAFVLYWYLERPGVENLVGKWFGVDTHRMNQLSQEISDERVELAKLKDNLTYSLFSMARVEPSRTPHPTFKRHNSYDSFFSSNSQDGFDKGNGDFSMGGERSLIQPS